MNDYNELIESLRSMDPMVCSTAADAIESLQSRVAELESRLEISPLHNVDGIMARDATIKLQDERIAELEAEREKQKPVAYMRKWKFDGEEPKKNRNESGRMAWPFKFKLLPVTVNRCLCDDVPLYASIPVTAPVRLTDEQINEASGNGILDCLQDPYDKDESGDNYSSIPHDLRRFSRAVETAVLRANGFKVEGEQ